MMSKLIYIYIMCFLLFISSCGTYTTYYGETYTHINIDAISKIHRLDLSHQNLKTLPSAIYDIKHLRMVNLSNNRLLDLEQSLEQLSIHKEIEVLILDSLQIKKIPTTIQLFPKLKQISLINNPDIDIADLVSQISELPITFLNLKRNNITKLPQNISTLSSLRDLNLSYNQLHDAPSYSYLGKLPKLYSLWIDHNKLTELPETIGSLDQVRFLYIDNNKLSTLPNELSTMRKVWVIHAGYNEFAELPEVFASMRVLLMVHINNNQIQFIPEIYETEKYPLAGLLLDNNPLSVSEIKKAKKVFKGFFLLSFEQKEY